MNELKKKKKFFRAFWQASLYTYSNDILSQYPTIVYDQVRSYYNYGRYEFSVKDATVKNGINVKIVFES